MEKQKQSLEETRNLLPRVRSLNNPKTSLISTRDVERNTFKLAMVSDKKMSEMEVRLDKISVPDKIKLHKQMGDIIYSDLLHAEDPKYRTSSIIRIISITRGKGQDSSGYDGV